MGEHPALVAAARHGLVADIAPVVVDAADTDELLRVARIDRLGGLVATALIDGVVEMNEETTAQVVELWHEQLVTVVVAESLAVRVAALFDRAGVSWRLTKGSAVARLDYPDPNVRLFGDVDVIVHPGSWTRALDALGAAGWTREAPEIGPGFDRSFGKGATLTAPDGAELDLHRRLAIGRFGVRLPTEALFTDLDVVTVGGRVIPTLDGPGRLLHACYHAALGGFRHLRAHRDVAQLLLVSEVDWAATAHMATRHGVQAVVARAVLDAWDALDLTVDHPARAWAAGTRIGRGDARALRVFAEERSFSQQALTAVTPLVGHGALRYLWTLSTQGGRGPLRPSAALGRARRAVGDLRR